MKKHHHLLPIVKKYIKKQKNIKPDIDLDAEFKKLECEFAEYLGLQTSRMDC